MLREASAINSDDTEVADGRLGTVSDLLFEDVGSKTLRPAIRPSLSMEPMKKSS